jgi:hypothetical protein
MQDFTSTERPKKGLRIEDLSIEDRQKLVGSFAWLIQEDKKQNPELYQLKKTQNND